MEMGIATMCDSMDIARHSLIFLALFDMIVLACAYLIVGQVVNLVVNFRRMANQPVGIASLV
jgi:hypothetical protein